MPKAKKEPSLALPGIITSTVPCSDDLLRNSIPGLMGDIGNLARELDAVRNKGDALTMARAFVALHRVHEMITAISGKDGGMMPGLIDRYKKIEVPAIFEAAGVPHMALAEGYRVGVATKIMATVRAPKRDEAFQWLRDNGKAWLITPSVAWQTLTSEATRMMEEDNLELPEELFNVNPVNTVSVTRTK